MESKLVVLIVLLLSLSACTTKKLSQPIKIDESSNIESIEKVIKIDIVWAGHPVGFCLYTHGDRQYAAYYNANRNLVVGQRNLDDEKFDLFIMPATQRKTSGGTSTVLVWDMQKTKTSDMY